jgi:hypothetical protein
VTNTDLETISLIQGKSINELYASGHQSTIAQNSLLDDPNPLEHQAISGGANTLAGEDNVSVILPGQQQQPDPMTAFNLSEGVEGKTKKGATGPIPF